MTNLVIEISAHDVVDMFLFACALAIVWPMVLIATFGLGKKTLAQEGKQSHCLPMNTPSSQDQAQEQQQ